MLLRLNVATTPTWRIQRRHGQRGEKAFLGRRKSAVAQPPNQRNAHWQTAHFSEDFGYSLAEFETTSFWLCVPQTNFQQTTKAATPEAPPEQEESFVSRLVELRSPWQLRFRKGHEWLPRGVAIYGAGHVGVALSLPVVLYQAWLLAHPVFTNTKKISAAAHCFLVFALSPPLQPLQCPPSKLCETVSLALLSEFRCCKVREQPLSIQLNRVVCVVGAFTTATGAGGVLGRCLLWDKFLSLRCTWCAKLAA